MEETQAGNMCITFNGSPGTTIDSGYSPTNANDEMDITPF